MKRFLPFILLVFAMNAVWAQQIDLTFTGCGAGNSHVQLDRVLVTNLTRGWQETLTWPDTVLTLQASTGIDENAALNTFKLKQNNPNPFRGETMVELTVSELGATTMEIHDMSGEIVGRQHTIELIPGTHLFRIHLAEAGIYILNAWQNGKTSSIKMVNNGGSVSGIEYAGTGKLTTETYELKNGLRGISTRYFALGDRMEYVGYATIENEIIESQRITQDQEGSDTFLLHFARLPIVTTAPVVDITRSMAVVGGNVISDGGTTVTERGVCYTTTGVPTISDDCQPMGSGEGIFSDDLVDLEPRTTYFLRAYAINSEGTAYGDMITFETLDIRSCLEAGSVTDIDGNVYGTLQLGDQCWMRENLRTTHFADSSLIILGTDTNTAARRYYPANDSNNVEVYGYLYNQNAVLGQCAPSDSNPSGVQGICPTGWHVPSGAEWEQLFDYVSSQNQFLCASNYTNTAKALAANKCWDSSEEDCAVGNDISRNDATGFAAIPAGALYEYDLSQHAHFWSSSKRLGTQSMYYICISYESAVIFSGYYLENNAFSVRCLRD